MTQLKAHFFSRNFSRIWFVLFILSFFSSPLSSKEIQKDNLVRLATTTSTENSGLLGYLLPVFEKDTGYKVHTIAVGTGKALRMGRDGDVDVLLVHAIIAEKKFVAEGNGSERFDVMMNDFIIVGPKNDPAHLGTVKTVNGAFEKIASTNSRFISRGDDSGTHKKELGIWKTTQMNLDKQKNKWYLEAGQGMGKVLKIAGEMEAYTLTDRGTWLAYANKSPLSIVFEGDAQLFNPYGIIAVNPDKYNDVNNKGAVALIYWMTSSKGQKLIGDFKIAGKTLFKPTAFTLASGVKGTLSK